MAAGVGLLALLLYLPTLRNGFAYDDVPLIQSQPKVQSLRQLPSLLTASYWESAHHGLYRPLTAISFAIDWTLYGGAAWGFHLTNALLNAAAVALAFLLLARLTSTMGALAGAALFAAHPVHVEAVASIVNRADVIAAGCILGAGLLWLRRGVGGRRPWIAALFALGLLAKESALMLPFLLALIDVGCGELRPGAVREWWERRRPALEALAAAGVVYLALRYMVLGTMAPGEINPAMEVARDTAGRLGTALQIWPHVLRLLFFPRTLLADYGPRVLLPVTLWSGAAMGGAAVLAALLVGGVLAYRRGWRLAGMALLWAPVALLPAANLLVPVGVLLAERTLFLPSFAVSLMAAAAASRARTRWGAAGTRAAAVAAGVLALAGGARVLERIPDWQSTDTLFAAQVAAAPESYRAHWQIARTAALQAEERRALAAYARAIELWPYRRELVFEAAAFAGFHEDWPSVRTLTAHLIRRWPSDVYAYRLYATAAWRLGDRETALKAVDAGLRYAPQDDVLTRMRQAILSPTPQRPGRRG